MRRFTILAAECAEQELQAWQDVGFMLAATAAAGEGHPPDVILLQLVEWHKTAWQLVGSMLPKLYVVLSRREIQPPAMFSGIYDHQFIAGKGICFNIGSRLQGTVTVPDWEVFGSGATLTVAEQIKAVAGSVYRFLLEDIFRETAEWCGHMSSVVGPR
ncbi:MAG TPA: hypothetical protein PK728_06490 [Bacillota bacterium]|nr:hypothetical protein [Bacillota bacterium]